MPEDNSGRPSGDRRRADAVRTRMQPVVPRVDHGHDERTRADRDRDAPGDLRDRDLRDRDEDGGKDEKDDKKSAINTAQVAGGALASVTAAFLGSQLGVAGTVVGAALTSVVITVGGTLYQRSLENARDKAKTAAAKAAVARGKRGTALHHAKVKGQAAAIEQAREDRPEPPAAAPQSPPDPDRTKRIALTPGLQWPGGERVVDDGTERIAEPTRVVAPVGGEQATEVVAPPKRRTKQRWTMVAATSALVFAIGMIVVTGFEGVTGRTLSGGTGTTIGQVVRPGPPPPPEPVEPVVPETTTEETGTDEPEPSGETSTQEPTRTGEPSAPSETPQEPTPTQQPSSTPTQEQTPTQPQDEPSAGLDGQGELIPRTGE
ncbi:hypothetical protein [Saccharopolyspora sp. CA-218241]|uniref:hypothetical protein n=1 Tax=Saccharopolyspora sp. CA-218241 TaxID=3240027 RepID=UPI003D97A5DB